jgi:hypothetical protein
MIEYLEVWRIWEGLEATEFKLYLHKKGRLDIVFFSPSHSGKIIVKKIIRTHINQGLAM